MEEDVRKRLENLEFHQHEQAEEIKLLRQQVSERDADDARKEILQLLCDGQGVLLTENQLELMETWDDGEEDQTELIDPRIYEATEYDGKTMLGLVECIRKRKAQRSVARDAALASTV